MRYRGSITLELLIAFGVLALTLSALMLVQDASSARSIRADADALAIARKLLGQVRTGDETRNGLTYTVDSSTQHISACVRLFAVSVQLKNAMHIFPLTLASYEMDLEESDWLGNDCSLPTFVPFDHLESRMSYAFPDTSVTAMDMVGEVIYLGLQEEPYFLVYDGGWIEPEFSLPDAVTDIDAIHSEGGRYVFATLATSTAGQLAVIDADEMELVGIHRLNGVTSLTSAGHGDQVYYYDDRL